MSNNPPCNLRHRPTLTYHTYRHADPLASGFSKHPIGPRVSRWYTERAYTIGKRACDRSALFYFIGKKLRRIGIPPMTHDWHSHRMMSIARSENIQYSSSGILQGIRHRVSVFSTHLFLF